MGSWAEPSGLLMGRVTVMGDDRAPRIGRVVRGGRCFDVTKPRLDKEFAAIQPMWRGERCCARWCAMGRGSLTLRPAQGRPIDRLGADEWIVDSECESRLTAGHDGEA